MSMTMTEKILARHAGKKDVVPGDNIWVDVDILMTHDVCGPGTIGVFKREFGPTAKVWDREKVVIIPDHYIFTKDEMCHRNIDTLREFAKEQNIRYFYDVGTPSYQGVCHATLAQQGHCRPGEVMFGTDSHTCTAGAFGQFSTGIGNTDAGFIMGAGKLLIKVPETMRFVFNGKMPSYLMAKDMILWIIGEIGVDGATYRAMEFAGEAVYRLSVEERMTLCNMAIEAGGKNGIISPDETVFNYVKARTSKPFEPAFNDKGAKYKIELHFDVDKLEPVVAMPHSPDNRQLAKNLKEVKLDRCYIGSCTGGKIEDFIAAAKVLCGKTVVTPTYIVPATVEVEKEFDTKMVNGKTLKQIFKEAGCIDPAPPSCAACLGGPEDTFGRLNNDEVCISTTNRNFPGRMGSKGSAVYLASPMTVAASALKGRITDPREVL